MRYLPFTSTEIAPLFLTLSLIGILFGAALISLGFVIPTKLRAHGIWHSRIVLGLSFVGVLVGTYVTTFVKHPWQGQVWDLLLTLYIILPLIPAFFAVIISHLHPAQKSSIGD